MENTNICPYCELPMEGKVHGNRIYHPDCREDAKRILNSLRYDRIKEMDKLAIRLDDVLQSFYSLSNGKVAIDKKLLESRDFRFDFNTRMVENNGAKIFWILNYGYSYVESGKKLIIYYDDKAV